MLILQFIPEKIASINIRGTRDSPGCAGREGCDIFNSPRVENRETRQHVICFICFEDEAVTCGEVGGW